MSKREKIIGVIVIVLTVLWAVLSLPQDKSKNLRNTATAKPEKSSPKTRSDPDITVLGLDDIERLLQHITLRSHPTDLTQVRDPFQKLKAKAAPIGFEDLFLSGVSWESEQPAALINNEIFYEGDTLFDFKIYSIRKEEVILYKGMEKYILKFSTEFSEGESQL